MTPKRSGSTLPSAIAGIGPSLVGGDESHLDVAAHDLDVLARLDVGLGVKVAHPRPDPAGERSVRQFVDDADTASSLAESGEELLFSPDRGD